MTAKELAEILSGREIMEEITPTEEEQAADAGLIVVFGDDDGNMEFRGAIDGEIGCHGGGTAYLTKSGILGYPSCDTAKLCSCPYFTVARNAAKTIKAMWHNDGGPYWTFETDIPHETFEVYDDGEVWCVGIVFNMEDIAVIYDRKEAGT